MYIYPNIYIYNININKYIYVYLSIYRSIHLSVYPSIYVSIYLIHICLYTILHLLAPSRTTNPLWEVIRTVAAPPSIVVKWGRWFFMWTFVVLFLPCVVWCCLIVCLCAWPISLLTNPTLKGALCAYVIRLRVSYNQNYESLSQNSLRYLGKMNLP